MKYKLLALDIDDTVAAMNTHIPSQKVLKALQKAAEKVAISFVTARSSSEFNLFLTSFTLAPAYHVVENGAKVINPKGELEYDLHIPHDEVQAIVNITEPYFLEMGFLSDRHWIEEQIPAEYAETITGLSFTCSSLEQAHLLKQAVSTLPHRYAIHIGRHWTNHPDWTAILLSHKDATKGTGMSYIQKKLGISQDETIAVGDGATDLDMFKVAGVKIAMENAEDVLKQAADYVCPSIDQDGLATVIQKYILS